MASRHFMNKQHGAHMGAEGFNKARKGKTPPHVHIHSDGSKVHVHVMHHDRQPEHHEHEHHDIEGIKSHIDEHFGDASQDHGVDGGEGGDEAVNLLDEEA